MTYTVSRKVQQLNEANPFDYLTELQRHADRLAVSPQLWMPWNYRARLD